MSASPITEERIAELRKVAEAAANANPGHWRAYDPAVADMSYWCVCAAGNLTDDMDKEVAEHLAAFQPTAVLALLDDIARLEALLATGKTMLLDRQGKLSAAQAREASALSQRDELAKALEEAVAGLKEIGESSEGYEDGCKAMGLPMDMAWRSLVVEQANIAHDTLDRVSEIRSLARATAPPAPASGEGER